MDKIKATTSNVKIQNAPRRDVTKYFVRETVLGRILISANENAVTGLGFGNHHLWDADNVESPIIREAFTQLIEYLEGSRRNFDLELIHGGSDFQVSVWSQLRKIPHGKTKSYKEIAIAINNPKAYLAVGQACGKNPIPIFIPCHRVVGFDGNLTGYAGGMNLKKQLLKIESNGPCG